MSMTLPVGITKQLLFLEKKITQFNHFKLITNGINKF